MTKLFKVSFFFFLICLLCHSSAYGAWVWTPETGGWINPKGAVKDTAEQQFKYAMGFYDAKDYKRALTEFDKLVKFYPNSYNAPLAQYYIGRCYEDLESYYHAYLGYQKTIEAYPYAKNREEIIKREYDIGTRFLQGEKAKILGLAVLPATDKAIEIFEQVVRNSPYGEYADNAQFKTGEAYKNSGRYTEAMMAFQKLVVEYPKSELFEDANYEIAQCAYLASLGSSYDQETTDTAIERFEDFVEDSGDGEFSKEAKKSLHVLKEKKAKSLYDTAQFYERIGQRKSAAVYYKELADNYPDTSLAKESVTRIMEIEKGLSRSWKR